MNTAFSMSQAVQKTQQLEKALANAHQRAVKYRDTLSQIDSRISLLRLILTIVVLAVLASLFSSWETTQKVLAGFGFVALFFVSSALHKRFQSKVQFWKTMVTSLELSMARNERDHTAIASHVPPWHKKVAQATPAGHVYATDLDVNTTFFRWLDSCVTEEGSTRLLEVLLSAGLSPEAKEVRDLRQSRARALARRSRIIREMECLRLNEDYIAEYVQNESGQSTDPFQGLENLNKKMSPVLTYGFAGVSIVAWAVLLLPGLAAFFQTGSSEALVRALMIYAFFPLAGIGVYKSIVELAQGLRRKATTMRAILTHMHALEHLEGFTPFACVSEKAQARVSAMEFVLSLVSLRGNPVLWLALHLILPFDAIVSLALTLQFQKIAPRMRQWWLDVIEFDFLCSVARIAAENPTFQFVETTLKGKDARASVRSTDMGHPLLAAKVRVCNSLSLESQMPLVLLTGSNMAGKSTFLRTLGLNMLLFNMGAPVCAASFESSPCRVLCAIRVDDSLSEGTSYFYAEVKRLKVILNSLGAAHEAPALFLVDEIFRGTNNKERFVGSWHMLEAFLNSGAFGVVSTHDLALTELARKDTRLHNMHFREHVEGSSLQFDFLLREGPCPTTNALHIMRAEGLPIPSNESHDLSMASSKGQKNA